MKKSTAKAMPPIGMCLIAARHCSFRTSTLSYWRWPRCNFTVHAGLHILPQEVKYDEGRALISRHYRQLSAVAHCLRALKCAPARHRLAVIVRLPSRDGRQHYSRSAFIILRMAGVAMTLSPRMTAAFIKFPDGF